MKKLSKLLDPTEAESREKDIARARKTYEENFGTLDLKNIRVYQNLFEIFWYTQVPCFDQILTSDEKGETGMLKRCYWKAHLMSCAAIFKTRPTDRGMCCSFNMEAAENVLKQSRYTSALNKLQQQEQNLSYPSAAKEGTILEDMKPQAGLTKGLAVVLDAHGDLLAPGSIFDDFRGFTSTVTAPGEYPITQRKAKIIKPGHLNMIEISAVNVKADATIKSITPKARKCYFEDEFQLKMHKNYSKSNCYLECSLEYASKKVGKKHNSSQCIPWFFPVNDNSEVKICDPWEKKEFEEILQIMPSNVCDHCLPDCNGNIYETRINIAEFKKCDYTNLGASMFCDLEAGDMNPSIWTQEARDEFEKGIGDVPKYMLKNQENQTKYSNRRSYNRNPEILKKMPLSHRLAKDPTYDAFENDIAMAYFYFENADILQLQINKKMTAFEYVSAVGGNFGLGIGFSLISLIEIIYWLTIRFWQNKEKRGERVRRKDIR